MKLRILNIFTSESQDRALKIRYDKYLIFTQLGFTSSDGFSTEKLRDDAHKFMNEIERRPRGIGAWLSSPFGCLRRAQRPKWFRLFLLDQTRT
jgi:hypothetical protein